MFVIYESYTIIVLTVLQYAQVNDAIQIATGRHVAIKLVYKEEHPTEREVMDYLSSEAFLKDKRNHCIPLLEVLRPLGDDNIKLEMFVMPYARPIETPPFDTVGEVVQCVRELLEVKSISLPWKCHG